VPLRVAVQEGFVGPFRDFFSRYGFGLALALLLFVALFRLPDQMLGVMAYPFYLDAGFTKTQIAEVSKVYGVIIGIAGALLGGWAVTRFEMRRLLAVAALGVALSNMLYLLMAQNPGQTWAFVATLSGRQLCARFCGAGPGRLHVRPGQSQFHRHAVRVAQLTGQPAWQADRRDVRISRQGFRLSGPVRHQHGIDRAHPVGPGPALEAVTHTHGQAIRPAQRTVETV